MKLKGLTKLALSGVALAAVAATLGTSTYAWYVTNSTATASGVQGAATAGGLGNVLVAQKPTTTEGEGVNGHGAFQQNIVMENSSFNKVLTTQSGLTPVSPQVYTAASGDNPASYEAATTINAETKWYGVDGAEDKTGNYLQFDLWLLSTSKTTITFEYTFVNTTTTFTPQLSYAATGSPVAQGATFIKNIEDALRMAYTQTDYTSSTSGDTTTYTAGTPKTTVIMDVAGSAAKTSSTATDTNVSFASGGNAHNYYKAVLGNDPLLKTELTGSKTAQTITVVAGEETKLSFYVWLEGTDTDCFDSVSGQSFTLNFSFTALNNNNNDNNSGNGGN